MYNYNVLLYINYAKNSVLRKMKKVKSFGKKSAAIITTSIVVALCIAVMVVNIFIPVRYLSAYFVARAQREQGYLTVTFADVGFGDCILAELPDGKTMLIDGGNGDYQNTLEVLTLLNSKNVDTIDYLVCTSVKDEHCGGLAEILKYKQAGRAYIPDCTNTRVTEEYHSFVTALEEQGVETRIAQAGEGVAGDGYFFSFLSPSNGAAGDNEYALLNQSATSDNIDRASAVLWLQYGDNCFLFTSDANEDTLARIVTEYRQCVQLLQPFCPVGDNEVELEKCDVVSVPAHGGKNGAYAPFYDLISPSEAVVSVGENFSECPDNAAMSVVCAYVQPMYTCYDGTITITADKYEYIVDKEMT